MIPFEIKTIKIDNTNTVKIAEEFFKDWVFETELICVFNENAVQELTDILIEEINND